MRAVFDTNVLIDLLLGIPEAATEFQAYDEVLVSVVSEAELLVGREPQEIASVDTLLLQTRILPVDSAIAREAALLRRTYRLGLPDALIWASARLHDCMFITRDRGFPADRAVHIPYQV